MIVLTRLIIVSSLSILLLAAPALADSRLRIFTVNYPLAYFAERIGGNLVEVVFPAPADVDPAFWVPDETTIGNYQKADLILLNGADYAKWTKKVSLPLLRTVDTSRSFRDEFIAVNSQVTHSHGPEGAHSHSGTAFTTWLDLSLATRQAEAIFKTFSQRLPEHQAALEGNYLALEEDLSLLDNKLLQLSKSNPSLALLGSHPVYQYLARGYGLNMRMLMWEPDEIPTESQWQDLQTITDGHDADWMLWEALPVVESIDRLEKMGIQSLVYSPCFNRPEQGDFLSVMQQNVANLAAALGKDE
jgi:zinc transport system substrate-binding protein